MDDNSKIEKILKVSKDFNKRISQLSAEYDIEYAKLSKEGNLLLSNRVNSTALIENVELLINGIAHTPKSFSKEFEEINNNKAEFRKAYDFGKEQVKNITESAAGVAAGAAGGLGFAAAAPSVAMWAATTFGTASTGAAISSLSGAAATNAALAWLGGGALTAGGGGMAAGNALLALAGPVGWGIAGVSFLASILFLWRKSVKAKEEKARQILKMMDCIANTRRIRIMISTLKKETTRIRKVIKKLYDTCRPLSNLNYLTFDEESKTNLGSLVNYTKSLSVLLTKTIE